MFHLGVQSGPEHRLDPSMVITTHPHTYFTPRLHTHPLLHATHGSSLIQSILGPVWSRDRSIVIQVHPEGPAWNRASSFETGRCAGLDWTKDDDDSDMVILGPVTTLFSSLLPPPSISLSQE